MTEKETSEPAIPPPSKIKNTDWRGRIATAKAAREAGRALRHQLPATSSHRRAQRPVG